VKPAFVHDPVCKCLIPAFVAEVGGDPSHV
jgi:hypothetical protein